MTDSIEIKHVPVAKVSPEIYAIVSPDIDPKKLEKQYAEIGEYFEEVIQRRIASFDFY